MVTKRDFTDRFLKAIKPAEPGKRVILHDAQIPGFGIRVTERSAEENKGSFVLVTRFPGNTNPVPRRLPRHVARQGSADRARMSRNLRQGVDPKAKEAERRHEEERRRADTFAAVFLAFADDRCCRKIRFFG